MSNKEQQVITLVHEIRGLELNLQEKREQLRALIGAEPAKNATSTKKAPVVRNVSAEVLAFVKANPGQPAKDIIKALGLGKREGTARAALKKHQQAGRLGNVGGLWWPAVETQKAPEVAPPGQKFDTSDVKNHRIPDPAFAYGAANAGD